MQEPADLDDSEPDDFEKDADLDKIVYNSTHFSFQAIFFVLKSSLIANHAQNYYTQLIYTIINPPPEI